ncbi:MAG: hypothetical protein PUP92_11250 [Rhizonema sp. PD38]|nr:hypothetical protein [Rhizonema sp. PD38]
MICLLKRMFLAIAAFYLSERLVADYSVIALFFLLIDGSLTEIIYFEIGVIT